MAYKAFIVGVDTLSLAYCARDAERLSASLEKYGYEIISEGHNKPRLQAAFDMMLDDVTQTDTLLLYFSGHGVMERGKLWFLLSDDGSKLANKLNINQWLESFSDCRASNKLIILDCCHAGQGIVDLQLELSDRYLVLAASARLEKSIELEALQASFFTYHLCQALDNPPQTVLEGEKNISVQKLHTWLEGEARKHNGQNATQVPVPKLIGSHSDFALALLPSDEASSALKLSAEARRLQIVEQRYRELLLRTCDIVNLANLPEQDRHLVTRTLELRRLYVPLRAWVDVKAGEEAKEAQWEEIEKRRMTSWSAHLATEARRRERERAAIGERLAEAGRLVVLGDPGAGKTTLTRWLATAYLLRLKGDTNWQDLPDVKTLPDEDWLPIIVRCRDLNPTSLTGALDDILSHTLRKAEMTVADAATLQNVLRERLHAGNALLMLDGLDEITDPILRARFCQQLEQIHLAHPDAPIIATSRIVGYREMGYRIGRGFEHVTLADLEPDEKDDFIRRWCSLTELPEQHTEAAHNLIHDVHSTDRIERLTGNPMLLTTMALVKRKVGKLPSRRADLYGEAVQVLLNWRSDVDQPLEQHEAIPQLEYVAYGMCDQGVQRLRRDEILSLITQMRAEHPNLYQVHNHTPEEFLNRLEARTGLIVEAGRTRHLGLEEMVYEFRHLTFQEYLAARALVDERFPGRKAGQSLAEHIAPLAGHLAETEFTKGGEKEMAVVENWREALRLSVAICRDSDVDSVLRAMMTPLPDESEFTARARIILAALCIADDPNVSEEVARQIFEIFASHVQEGDRGFAIKTGVQVAAVAVAETRWATLLSQCLVTEYVRRDSVSRDYMGDIAGLVAAYSVPSEAEAISAWWGDQTKLLQEGSEYQAIQSALGIAALIATKNTVEIIPEQIASLLARLSESAPIAHAAVKALASLAGFYGQPDHAWEPAIPDIAQFVSFISVPANDPEAIRYLTWILGDKKVVAAIDPLATWLNHPSSELRASVATAFGSIGSERAVEPLLALLADTDTNVYGSAASALGQIGDDRAVEPLLTSLTHTDANVRNSTTRALGNLKSERAVEPLLALLTDTDANVRGTAAEALGQIGDERAVDPLLALLTDTTTNVYGSAARALGQIGDERAIEPLLALLADTDANVRGSAARALGQIGDERAIEPLLALLADAAANVRGSAVVALGQIGDERAVEPLLTLLADITPYVRNSAVGALGQIRDVRAVEPLLALLADAAASVRGSAARSLGQIGDERAVEPLLALLADITPYVRNPAAEALGQIGDERAVEPLLALLADTNANVRGTAARALGQIGDERAVKPLLALLADTNANVRGTAAEALGQIGDERAVKPLLTLLTHSHANVRGLTARALGQIRDERAVEPLLTLLTHSHANVRGSAAGALGKMGNTRAIESLLTLLTHSHAYVCSWAAWALGQIGDEHAVEPLLALLAHTHAYVRGAAAGALGQIGDEHVVEPLLALLAHTHAYVRGSAAWALGQIGDERAVEPLLALLTDTAANVRNSTAKALGNLKSERAVEPLLTLLNHTDACVRSSAAETLGNLKSERAVEPLLTLLTDNNTKARGSAAEALGNLKSERVVEPLLTLLADTDARVCGWATEALGQIGDERAVEPLLALLTHTQANVRNSATEALGNLKNERAVEPLLTLLTHTQANVRNSAAEALGNLKNERAVEPLLALLADNNTKARSSAARALGNLKNERAVEPLLALLADNNTKARSSAARALGNLKNERAVEPLLALLADNNTNTRGSAARALGEIDDERAVELMIALLEDANINVRRNAVGALSCHIEPENRHLLSRDLDGLHPFLDPRHIISAAWVAKAARALKLPSEAVQARYEDLAPRFKLRLAWKEIRD